MKENIILEKALLFSVRIISLVEFLDDNKHRSVANQVLRSGTSIGANIAESHYAASNADFINKLKIAEKEVSETLYWLKVFKAASYINEKQYDSLFADLSELQKLLGASIKTSKTKIVKF